MCVGPGLISLIRFIVLIPMVIIGIPIYSYVHGVWTEHWLGKDGKPVFALVTQALPKRFFEYRYSVDGKDYAGKDYRYWEDEQSHKLQVGGQATVFVSASHPWLSSLRTIRMAWAGFPLALLLVLLEFFCLAALVDPNGRWAVSRWFLNL